MDDVDEDGDDCTRCGPRGPIAPRPTDASLPPVLAEALARCARCLTHDGITIHRAHVAEAHDAFGAFAEPLEPALAVRAVAARPELASAALLVAEPDAVLVHPADVQRARLAALVHIGVPDVLLEGTRAALAAAEAAGDRRLEWERVHAWPAAEHFPGTVAFGEIARVLAERALAPLLEPHDRAEVLGAIDWAIANIVLDDEMLGYRDELAARGRDLAVQFLEVFDHRDTILDHAHTALLHHGHAADAAQLYRAWLDIAVPRAWAKVVTVTGRARAVP